MVNRLSKTSQRWHSSLLWYNQVSAHTNIFLARALFLVFFKLFTWETALNPTATNILIFFSCSHLWQPVVCPQSYKCLEISFFECSYSYVVTFLTEKHCGLPCNFWSIHTLTCKKNPQKTITKPKWSPLQCFSFKRRKGKKLFFRPRFIFYSWVIAVPSSRGSVYYPDLRSTFTSGCQCNSVMI